MTNLSGISIEIVTGGIQPSNGLKNHRVDEIRYPKQADSGDQGGGETHLEPFVEQKWDEEYEGQRDRCQDRARIEVELIHVAVFPVRKDEAKQ